MKYLYFVLDYIPNGELFRLIKRESKLSAFLKAIIDGLSLELTRFITAEIIEALDYMHSEGICHRDLKPSNILFDDNNHIKIVRKFPNKVVRFWLR